MGRCGCECMLEFDNCMLHCMDHVFMCMAVAGITHPRCWVLDLGCVDCVCSCSGNNSWVWECTSYHLSVGGTRKSPRQLPVQQLLMKNLASPQGLYCVAASTGPQSSPGAAGLGCPMKDHKAQGCVHVSTAVARHSATHKRNQMLVGGSEGQG